MLLLNKDFLLNKDTILTKLLYSNINFSKNSLSEATRRSVRNFQTFKHSLNSFVGLFLESWVWR